MPRYDLRGALNFLSRLERNNERPWFEAHRADYDAARAAYAAFLDDVIARLAKSENLLDLNGKECMARIFRDVRFSKDKAPYKTNFAALIAPGGWRTKEHGYYVSIQPGGRSLVAGGLYTPSPAQLGGFRDAIARDARPFKRIVAARGFKAAFGTVEGEHLTRVPRGYAPDHPELGLLKLKQVVAYHPVSDDEVASNEFASRVAGLCRTMRPFLAYLKRVAGGGGRRTG